MASRTKPTRKGSHLQGLRGHVMKGGFDLSQIMDFVKNAVAELKRGKYISKGAQMYRDTGLPYSGEVGKVGSIAGQLGFGKRKVGRPKKAKTTTVKRKVGRPKKSCGGTCGGALSLAQRRGLVPLPKGYIAGSGQPKLAQRKSVKPSGPLFGKGLKSAGAGLKSAGAGLTIAGGSLVKRIRKTQFP